MCISTHNLLVRIFSASVIQSSCVVSVAPPPSPLATTTFVAPGSSSVHGQPRKGHFLFCSNPQISSCKLLHCISIGDLTTNLPTPCSTIWVRVVLGEMHGTNSLNEINTSHRSSQLNNRENFVWPVCIQILGNSSAIQPSKPQFRYK